MVINIILFFLFWIIAAGFNAIMDILKDKFYSSIFINFEKTAYVNGSWWNPYFSWRNKYKNGRPVNGPRFFGSTTFLVWITDAWHMAQMGMLSFIAGTIIVSLTMPLALSFWKIIVLFVGLKIIWGISFELIYKLLQKNG